MNMSYKSYVYTITSSNGNIFRVTGHLCGEFTGDVNYPQKGQWRGALMCSLISARINGWVNNREAGDSKRHRDHYDVIIMKYAYCGLMRSSMSLYMIVKWGYDIWHYQRSSYTSIFQANCRFYVPGTGLSHSMYYIYYRKILIAASPLHSHIPLPS